MLYDELLKVWPSPVVALNRAAAVAMVRGPEAALTEVEATKSKPGSGTAYLPKVISGEPVIGRSTSGAGIAQSASDLRRR